MDMIVFLNIKPEDHENFRMALDKLNLEEKRPMTNAEKQKAYRERKKATGSNVAVTEGNAVAKEERNEEGSLPLDGPSSPSSSPSYSPNNIPITPLTPSFQEAKREERDSAKSAKPAKSRYGNFGHVLLTAEEHTKLCEKFPHNIADRIQRLDDYLENNRKKHYDNHYLTILNWARRENEKQTAFPVQPKEETWLEVAQRIQRERDAQKETVEI